MGLIGSAFLGYTRVFGAGENRFQPPVTDGLLALYNPAYETGYNGSNVIYDLYGSNDLTINGGVHSQDTDNSIIFATSSNAETSTNISSSLHGTGSVFSVVFLTRNDSQAGDGYSGRWLLGPSGSGS